MFGEGISRSGEIIDLGVELDIIKKSGSWFSYNGTKIAQGRDAAKRVIRDNPELADELENLIMGSPQRKGRSHFRQKSPKPAEKKAASKASDDEDEPSADDINSIADGLFDDEDLPDDFSIEEDI